MNRPALIFELVVIGIGTALWLSFFLFGILIDVEWKSENTDSIMIIPAICGIYVLGILSDRFFRGVSDMFFQKAVEKEAWDEAVNISEHKKELSAFYAKGNHLMILEKIIRHKSEGLGRKIDYNHSRLRISRSWTIHFILIGFFLQFFARKYNLYRDFNTTLFSVLTFFILAIITWSTTRVFASDHVKDLVESYGVIKDFP